MIAADFKSLTSEEIGGDVGERVEGDVVDVAVSWSSAVD